MAGLAAVPELGYCPLIGAATILRSDEPLEIHEPDASLAGTRTAATLPTKPVANNPASGQTLVVDDHFSEQRGTG